MNFSISFTPINVISVYAAIISTGSFWLAVRLYRSGEPQLYLDWIYRVDRRRLAVVVQNLKRSDVTVTGIELYLIYEQVSKANMFGAISIKSEILTELPTFRHLDSSSQCEFPLRLQSRSEHSITLTGRYIKLPVGYPKDQILLQLVVLPIITGV